jgi:2-methylisocitrate lyase-like PEP mutase family enzyme
MRDFADHYARICEAVDIPVYVDGDTGFGGVNNVSQMVKAFEKAGAAALFFTDQVFPSRCGYLPGKQVIPVEQMLAKIKAALDARSDETMMICARTDVFALEGEDAAINRCRLFMEAGADMAKPQGIDTPQSIARVMRDVPGPFIATLSQAAGANKTTPADLERLGVPAATLPSLTLFAAARAVAENALRNIEARRQALESPSQQDAAKLEAEKVAANKKLADAENKAADARKDVSEIAAQATASIQANAERISKLEASYGSEVKALQAAQSNAAAALKALNARTEELTRSNARGVNDAKAAAAKELTEIQKALEEQKAAAGKANEQLAAAKADAAKNSAANAEKAMACPPTPERAFAAGW